MVWRNVLALLMVLSVGALAIHNLPYPGIWWDEAAQFWISQGLSNYAEPYESPCGLRDVIRMNQRENLDPGGFSLLLHVWTKVSKSLEWLRTLPLIFLLLAQGGLGWLAWRLSRSPTFALIAAATPLLYPPILYFGFEIRAYSMEMAGIVWGTLAFLFMIEKPSWIRVGVLGMVSVTFMTSRYSFIFFILALTGTLAYTIIKLPTHTRFTWLIRSAAFFIPVAVSGIAILIFMVQPQGQRWLEMKSAALRVTAPLYTQSAVLWGNESWIELIARNILSPVALPITLAIAFFLFGRRPLYRALGEFPFKAEWKAFHSNIHCIYLIILFLQTISILASLFGLYPWDIAARWSAYLVMLSALSLTVLGADVMFITNVLVKDTWLSSIGITRLHTSGKWLSLLIMIGITFHAFEYQQTVESPHRTNLVPQLDRLHTLGPPAGSVFVAFYEVPMVRYLYEFGPFQNHSGYPDMFRFEQKSEWREKRPINAQREGLRYIVAALPLQEAQARFPNDSLHTIDLPESRLLEIKKISRNLAASTYGKETS